MGIRLDNTVTSLFAQRQTNQAARRLSRGLGQLASGLRINRASEDAAGLVIAEGFRSSIRQLNQEISNIQSGINLSRTADGALESQGNALLRIRELAVQSANGTLNDSQRQALNAEAQELLQQVDSTARDTEFNGTTLLDGSAGQIALDAQGDLEVTLDESTTQSLNIDTIDISTAAGASAAIDAIDAAQQQVTSQRGTLGAQENRFEAAISQRSTQSINEQEAESRIRDLDVARAVIEQTRNQVLLQAGLSSVIQGNLQGQTALRLLGG